MQWKSDRDGADKWVSRWFKLLFLALLSTSINNAQGTPAGDGIAGLARTLLWNASNPDTNVAGYAVYIGFNSLEYEIRIEARTNLDAAIPALPPGQQVFICAVSYDSELLESEPSNEISFQTPVVLNQPANLTVDESVPLTVPISIVNGSLALHPFLYSLTLAPEGMQIDSQTGTLSWTPSETQGGATYTVVVTVTDSVNPALTDSRTFNLTVNEINTPPVLSTPGTLYVKENTALNTLVSATDSDLPANSLAFSFDSAPQGMTINPSTGAIAWTPGTNQVPSTNIIVVRVTDDGKPALSDVKAFAVVAKPLNYAPTLNRPTNQTVFESVSLANVYTVPLGGISPGKGNIIGQRVTAVVAASSNPALVPNPSVQYTPGNTNAVLSFSPVLNRNGSATITLIAQDDGGVLGGGVDSVTNTFTITVKPVNSQPTFGPLATNMIIIREDAGAQTFDNFVLNCNVGGDDETVQTLTFVVTNDNPGLFISQPKITRSTNDPTSAVLRFQAAANANGCATVIFTVKDNGGTNYNGVDISAAASFKIVVSPVNDPPTFTISPSVTMAEDTTQIIVITNISTGATNELSQTLSFQAHSDNPSVLPDPIIDYTQGQSTALLYLRPLPDAFGAAKITITVTDNGVSGFPPVDDFQSVTKTISVNITAVNDTPVFVGGQSLISDQDAALTRLTNWATAISAGPANESAQSLTFVTTNDNPALFKSQPALTSAGVLSFQPAPGATGAATASVYLKDSGGAKSDTQMFTIRILGDLYVADRGLSKTNGMLLRIKAVSGAQTNLVKALPNPYGLVQTASNSWIVAASGNFPSVPGALFQVRSNTSRTISSAQLFAAPFDLAITPDNNLIVADADADAGMGALIRVDPNTGVQSLLVNGFTNLAGIAAAADGAIYLSDGGDQTVPPSILKYSPLDGKTIISSGGLLSSPVGLTEDLATGDLIVVDPGSLKLLRINPRTGAQSVISAAGLFHHPTHVIIDDTGDFIITDDGAGQNALPQILRVHPNGAQSILSAGGLLASPQGLSHGLRNTTPVAN